MVQMDGKDWALVGAISITAALGLYSGVIGNLNKSLVFSLLAGFLLVVALAKHFNKTAEDGSLDEAEDDEEEEPDDETEDDLENDEEEESSEDEETAEAEQEDNDEPSLTEEENQKV